MITIIPTERIGLNPIVNQRDLIGRVGITALVPTVGIIDSITIINGKMKLKHEVKTVYEVTDYDIEVLVQGLYDPTYEFVYVQAGNNDSCYQFEVTGDIRPLEVYNAMKIRSGIIPIYSNPLLLNVLAADGHIEKGDYVIKVSW